MAIRAPRPVPLHLSQVHSRGQKRPEKEVPCPHALPAPAHPLIQVEPGAERARGSPPRRVPGSAATHSSFLSRSASDSRPGPRARGSGTLPRAAAGLGVRSPRTQEGTALAPDAARPGVGRSQGVRAVRTHRRSAPAPTPSPRPSALLRPLPAWRPLARHLGAGCAALTRSSRRARRSQQQDPQQCERDPAAPAGHGSGAPRPRRGKRLWLGVRGGAAGAGAWHGQRCAPPRLGSLTCAQAGWPGFRPAPRELELARPVPSPPLPPSASAPARRSQEAGTCRHLPWASPSCLG